MQLRPLSDLSKVDYYSPESFKSVTDLKNAVSEFVPCEVMIRLSEYDGKVYFESAHCVLDLEKQIVIHYENYRKKYYVGCWGFKNFEQLTGDTIEKLKANLTEPVTMGKLSKKKLEDWINYYTELYSLASIKNDECRTIIENFEESIKGLAVKRWDFQGQKRGSIIKNGLIYEFRICKDGYISEKIDIHYDVSNTLSNFFALADNKYQVNK